MLSRAIVFLVFAYTFPANAALPKTQNQDSASSFSFALIGDMPYNINSGVKSEEIENLTRQINRDEDVAWVLHVGDIKSGANTCSDRLLNDRLNRFKQFEKPFVLTPGDNEWTDCHRLVAGSFDPLERLSAIRKIFYSSEHELLGNLTKDIQSQANINKHYGEFIENKVWSKSKVVFSTIHIVGSNNGFIYSSKKGAKAKLKKDPRTSEAQRRMEAGISWLDYSFQQAKKSSAKGIFIAIHANPGLERKPNKKTSRAFKAFLKRLHKHTKSFEGQVVLAHGDSHYFRIDKPGLTSKKALANFTRIECFGDNRNWVKINVVPSHRNVFLFEPIVN